MYTGCGMRTLSTGSRSYSCATQTATRTVAGSVAAAEKIAPLTNSVVPESPPPSQHDLQRLYDFVNERYLSHLYLSWSTRSYLYMNLIAFAISCKRTVISLLYNISWVEGQQKVSGDNGSWRKHRVWHSRLPKVFLLTGP